jgi:hypothetical protein
LGNVIHTLILLLRQGSQEPGRRLTLSLIFPGFSGLEGAILLGIETGFGWSLVQDMNSGLTNKGLSALIICSAKPRNVIDQEGITYADPGADRLMDGPDVSHIALWL